MYDGVLLPARHHRHDCSYRKPDLKMKKEQDDLEPERYFKEDFAIFFWYFRTDVLPYSQKFRTREKISEDFRAGGRPGLALEDFRDLHDDERACREFRPLPVDTCLHLIVFGAAVLD